MGQIKLNVSFVMTALLKPEPMPGTCMKTEAQIQKRGIFNYCISFSNK